MKKRAATGGVQMFSFLDAMICTLGALLVLLHAFARHGETELVRKAEAKAVEQAGETPQIELELLQWRLEELKKVRAKTETQLAEERLRLAHVEDHQRRLKSKLDQLKVAATELQRLTDSGTNDHLRDQAALEAARVRLTEARHAVEEALENSERDASYSVVPYEGPNSTRRRPIYIECREDAMILQPEGVELVPEDFAGFLGPGNPLASALRGTREYYARQATPDEPGSEPYPLLLVRPEGVATYYAALTALESWGAQFGYELIGSDWKLKFPEPDQRLAHLLLQIVADARHRMRELMLATAELRSRRRGTTLRASSSGGFVAEGGHRGDRFGRSRYSDGSDWDSLDSDWLRGQSSSASDGEGDGRGNGNSGTSDRLASRNAGQSSRVGNAYDGGNTPGGEFGAGSGGSPYDHVGGDGSPYEHVGGDGSYGDPGGSRGGNSHQAMADGQNYGQGGNAPTTTGQSGDPNARASSAAGEGRGYSQTRSAAGASSGGTASRDGQFAGAGSTQASGGSSATPSRHSTGAAGAGDSCPAGDGSGAHATFTLKRKAQSMAEARGRGWGLPDAGDDLTGVTRPILVECHADRLVIVPETRGQQPQITQLDANAQDNMDNLVSDVWQHMKGWGIAGRGLYWRPTLVMVVDPDAVNRFAEIKTLLTDSGLDVRARRPPGSRTPANAQTAPTRR